MKNEKSEVCGAVFPYDDAIHCQLYKGHTIPHEYHDITINGVTKEGVTGVEITFA